MEEPTVTDSKHTFRITDENLGYAKIKVVGVGGGGGNAIVGSRTFSRTEYWGRR